MGLLLGFVPLIVFCALAPLSISLALWLSFATAFTFGIRSFLETGVLRLLDTAGVVLFGLLALVDGFIEPGMTLSWVGMIAESGYLALALWSLAVRRPFTAQYFPLPPERAAEAPFSERVNYVLTWVWAATLAIMAGADATITFVPRIIPGWATAVALAALAGALTFTWQFGVYIGRRLGKTPISGRR